MLLIRSALFSANSCACFIYFAQSEHKSASTPSTFTVFKTASF